MLADRDLLPAVAGAEQARLLNQVLTHPVFAEVAPQNLVAMVGVDGAQLAFQVLAHVVVHLVCVRTDGQAADFQHDLVAAGGVDCAGRQHELASGLGRVGSHVLVVVEAFPRLFRPLGLGDEVFDIRVVLKTDIRLGVLAGDNDIIAFVLAAQLVVVLGGVILRRMDLDRHVARAVEGVIVIEPDRKIAAESIDAFWAHQVNADSLDETVEGEFDAQRSQIGHNRHFHRDQVENPGTVLHLGWQLAQPFQVEAAPDAFQINWFAAQRVGDHDREQAL